MAETETAIIKTMPLLNGCGERKFVMSIQRLTMSPTIRRMIVNGIRLRFVGVFLGVPFCDLMSRNAGDKPLAIANSNVAIANANVAMARGVQL